MMRLPQPVFRRLLIVACFGTAFVVMASIFVPIGSQAEVAARIPRGARSLGRLESSRYVVEIFATTEGARYTVYGRDGSVMGQMLTADQVAARFDGLDIPDARADVPLEDMDPVVPRGKR